MAFTPQEIESLKTGGQKLVEILARLVAAAQPGANLLELDRLAGEIAHELGGTPSFKGFHGYPANSCLCPNQGVVHCIPTDYQLKSGDILTIDMGLHYEGLHTDAAVTIPIGQVPPATHKLLAGTYEALQVGTRALYPNIPIREVSAAIEGELKAHNLTIFREFVGHQIGSELHGERLIPNFAAGADPGTLPAGIAIALEPIAGVGSPQSRTIADGWSVHTADDQPAAHFEQTILITPDGYEIITPISQIVES